MCSSDLVLLCPRWGMLEVGCGGQQQRVIGAISRSSRSFGGGVEEERPKAMRRCSCWWCRARRCCCCFFSPPLSHRSRSRTIQRTIQPTRWLCVCVAVCGPSNLPYATHTPSYSPPTSRVPLPWPQTQPAAPHTHTCERNRSRHLPPHTHTSSKSATYSFTFLALSHASAPRWRASAVSAA